MGENNLDRCGLAYSLIAKELTINIDYYFSITNV